MADAAAEGGDGFGFVGERGNGIDEASELEDFADVADRVENFEAAALAIESDEGAHDGADAGTVHLRNAGEIYDYVGRAGVGEFAKFDVESVVAGANGDAALQIQDGDRAGFSRRDLQTHLRLPSAGSKIRRGPHATCREVRALYRRQRHGKNILLRAKAPLTRWRLMSELKLRPPTNPKFEICDLSG